jgi:mRNA-degrading endonuclease RelE of RelBE toxin-antitoxin system
LRFRTGRYRIVYAVEESRKEVMIVLIAKRGDVYRRLKR